MTDNDDGYCISYTVTVLEVRSCARPLRPPCQQRSALNDAGLFANVTVLHGTKVLCKKI